MNHEKKRLYSRIKLLVWLINILTIISILLSGCGTIMHGPTQDIVVTSNPPGAVVTPTDYTCWVRTPGVISLKRSDSTILTARLMGYEDMKIKVNCTLTPWLLGNGAFAWYDVQWWTGLDIPLAGVLALGDLMTGSIGQLSPAKVHFELIPKKKHQ